MRRNKSRCRRRASSSSRRGRRKIRGFLLNSATDKHPNGLANKNELVGKFMMTHHIAGTWALFDEDITPHMGTVGAQFMSYDRYAKTS